MVVLGLEVIVGKEVVCLGYDLKVENGKVYFEGDLFVIVRVNLWFCVVDCVKIVVGVFKVMIFDELFEKMKVLFWEDYLLFDV